MREVMAWIRAQALIPLLKMNEDTIIADINASRVYILSANAAIAIAADANADANLKANADIL